MEKKAREIAFLKIALPLLIVFAAIYIARAGYNTGDWLYKMTHS